MAWQYPFLLYGLSIPIALMVYRYYPEAVEPRDGSSETRLVDDLRAYASTIGRAFDRRLGLFMMGGFVLFFLKAGFATFVPVFVVNALGEPVTTVEFTGMVIIVIGLVTFSVSRGGDITGWKSWELVFPILAAFLYGVGNVLRRYGFLVTDATPIEGAALSATGACTTLLLFAALSGNRNVFSVSRRTYLYLAGVGILIPVGLLTLMIALSLGRIVVVVPLAGTAPLFTLAFSSVLLRDVERITLGVIFGSVCIVGGIYLLAGL
jgi:uncharacterized membrane protein